jgi:hypothetical protein
LFPNLHSVSEAAFKFGLNKTLDSGPAGLGEIRCP